MAISKVVYLADNVEPPLTAKMLPAIKVPEHFIQMITIVIGLGNPASGGVPWRKRSRKLSGNAW